MTSVVKDRGHCCEEMAQHLRMADIPLYYSAKFREYGIKVALEDAPYQLIVFCPWCGKRLPDSFRERWFENISAMGFDPGDERIPAAFLTDEWWG